MSDIPRKLFAAKLEDVPIGASALCTLCQLWSYVDGHEKKAGGPHFVFHTPQRLAKERDVGERAINTGLQVLRAAGLVTSGELGRKSGYWLHTPPGMEDSNQAPDRAVEAGDPPDVGDRSGGDRRSKLQEIGDRNCRDRRSKLQEIGDRNCGDRRSKLQRSAIEIAAPKEEQELSNVKQEGEQELAAARALAALAPPVLGAPPLGMSRPELRGLVELLREGEDPAVVERVLRRAPDLIARGMQPASRYGSEMFFGGVWARWRRSSWDLEVAEQAEANAKAAVEAKAEAAEQAQRERRREHEAEQVALLVRELEQRAQNPRPLNSMEATLVEHSAFDRARLTAPAAALTAARRALVAGATTQAELVRVIEALPEARLPSADEALERVRQARATAQREGRPVLEVLAGGGQVVADTPAAPTTREALIERRAELADAIEAANAAGDAAKYRELVQTRLDVARQLAALTPPTQQRL